MSECCGAQDRNSCPDCPDKDSVKRRSGHSRLRHDKETRTIVADKFDDISALRAENARLREEMKRANESAYENASAAHDEIKRMREELMRRIQASGETHPWDRPCVVTGVQCHEICRCRTQMERTLEYRSPDSVRAALRGDDAPEPSQ